MLKSRAPLWAYERQSDGVSLYPHFNFESFWNEICISLPTHHTRIRLKLKIDINQLCYNMFTVIGLKIIFTCLLTEIFFCFHCCSARHVGPGIILWYTAQLVTLEQLVLLILHWTWYCHSGVRVSVVVTMWKHGWLSPVSTTPHWSPLRMRTALMSCTVTTTDTLIYIFIIIKPLQTILHILHSLADNFFVN